MICSTLRAVEKRYVDFDPVDPEHIEAFKQLCLGTKRGGQLSSIRQHKQLRFNLEAPFTDVRTMMFHKVSEAHVKSISK